MMKKWLLCTAIAALYVAEIAAMSHLYRYGVRLPGANRNLRFATAVLALAQSGALFWLYRVMRKDTRMAWVPIGLCGIVLAAASFVYADPQGDAMAYIAYAKEPSLAVAYTTPRNYHPPRGFEAIHRAWPVLPNASYGPLYIEIVHAAVAPARSVARAMLDLRIIGIICLALLFASLIALRASPAIAALVIANPFLYFYYLYEVHNDIVAIALVMVAMVFAARRPFAAAIVAGAAAVVKAPFLLIGLLAFSHEGGGRRRIAAQIVVALAVGLIGSAFGGRAYLRDMTSHTNATYALAHSSLAMFFSGVHIVLAIVAVIAIAVALAAARFSLAGSFSLPALSSFLYPWYLAWGLPYVWSTRYAAPFLVLLPAAGLLVNAELGAHVFELVVLLAVLATYKDLVPMRKPLLRYS